MEFDIFDLLKLAKSINDLLKLEETETEEDSDRLYEARLKVKQQLLNTCIDCGIQSEIISNFLENALLN